MTIDDLYNMLNSAKDNVEKIKANYGSKIEKIQEQINNLNNLEGKSQQYIEDQKKKLEAQIDEIKSNLEQKAKQFAEDLQNKITQQITLFGTTLVQNQLSRLGVDLSTVIDTAQKALKEAQKLKNKI